MVHWVHRLSRPSLDLDVKIFNRVTAYGLQFDQDVSTAIRTLRGNFRLLGKRGRSFCRISYLKTIWESPIHPFLVLGFFHGQTVV